KCPCVTARAATARPSTGCGTGRSGAWRTLSPSAGCSAGRCATACGRSYPDARRLGAPDRPGAGRRAQPARARRAVPPSRLVPALRDGGTRSEEHTSELQSQSNLVCRLLLEKKKKTKQQVEITNTIKNNIRRIR